MGAALRLFRDDEQPPADDGAAPFELALDAPPPPAKRNTVDLCAALRWELGPEVWLTRDGCEALLRHCKIENFAWMLDTYPPEKIVLACCYALWMQREKKLKGPTPGPLVNWCLGKAESPINDRRAVMLPELEKSFRRHGAARRLV